MLNVISGEPPEDGLGLRGPEAQRRGILDHLIVLLADDIPVDRPGHHRLKVFIETDLAEVRTIKPLRVNGFKAWQKLETQEPAKRKSDLALPMAVDVLPIDFHFGDVVNDALDHRCDF